MMKFYAILVLIHCFHYLQGQTDEILDTDASKPSWKLIVEQFINETTALDNQWEELRTAKKKLSDEKQSMRTSISMMDVLRLNVGGETMMTTRASLTRARKSVLGILFNHRWEEKMWNDLDGNLYFDFHPTLFRHLLQQLRIAENAGSLDLSPPPSASSTIIQSYARMLQKLHLSVPTKASSDGIVALNVGGESILTRRHRFESMKLASLLSQSSARFIDADPQLFRRILRNDEEDGALCNKSSKDSSDRDGKRLALLRKRFDQFECSAVESTWKQDAVTVAGLNGRGVALDQLQFPYGMDIDDQGTLFIADYGNDRVVAWRKDAKSGEVVAGGKGRGNRTEQLSRPSIVLIDRTTNSLIVSESGNRRVMRWPMQNGVRGVVLLFDVQCNGLALDDERSLYVSDQERHEVRRYRHGQTDGIVVAGGHGAGSAYNQLNIPRSIFVDNEHSVYVADTNNHRVMKWTKDANEGILVAGGEGSGNSSTQLSFPAGLFVNASETIYVAESGNDRVTRWVKGSRVGTVVVGGHGQGAKANQLHHSEQLLFDRQGNLYVTDHHNHRIQRFDLK